MVFESQRPQRDRRRKIHSEIGGSSQLSVVSCQLGASVDRRIHLEERLIKNGSVMAPDPPAGTLCRLTFQ